MTTAKKAPAKSTSAKKTAGRKTASKKAAAKKTAAKKAAAKKTAAKKTAAKKTAAKKTAAKSGSADYTKPALREKIKAEVMAGDKGGHPGQWSARKAQLVATEYKAEGGGYKHERNETQQSLKDWGDEKWHTADGEQAIRSTKQGEETHRYLPDEAWKDLSPEQKRATDREKVAGSRKGKQFVKNTPAAAEARKRATK